MNDDHRCTDCGQWFPRRISRQDTLRQVPTASTEDTMTRAERRALDRNARQGMTIGGRMWHYALAAHLDHKAAGNPRRAELWRLATYPLSNIA